MFVLPERPTYKLVYAEPSEYAGLTVRLLSATTDEYLLIGELAEMDARDILAQAKLADALGEMLIEWDLFYPAVGDAEPRPVPANRSGLGSIPVPLMVRIANDWMMAVATVPNAATSSAETERSLGLGMDVPDINGD